MLQRLLLALVALCGRALASPQCRTDSEALRDIERWINEAGGLFSPAVAIEDAGEMGRGIFAKRNMAANTVFVRIPLNMVITPALTEYDFPDTHPVSDIDALATYVFISLNQGKDSRYWPYVTVLPKKVPLAFMRSEDEILSRLPPQEARRVLLDKRAIFGRGAKLGSTEGYSTMVSVVHSRVFVVRAKDPSTGRWVPSPALVPGVDFLNLSEIPNVDCETDAQSKFFECKTLVAINRGEQLLAPFGRSFNSREEKDAFTLIHYGFDSNDDDDDDGVSGTCVNYAARNTRKRVLD